MRSLLLLAVQLIVTLSKLSRPGGVRSVIAESLLLKQQLIISRRSSRRAAPLTTIDRFVLGLMTLFVRPRRVAKVAAILKPATLLRFHKALVDKKYRRLFSSAGARAKPGPKGPSDELITTSIEIKRRNPRFGYQRIAQQIAHSFGVKINGDVVRRVLAKHFACRYPDPSGPSTNRAPVEGLERSKCRIRGVLTAGNIAACLIEPAAADAQGLMYFIPVSIDSRHRLQPSRAFESAIERFGSDIDASSLHSPYTAPTQPLHEQTFEVCLA